MAQDRQDLDQDKLFVYELGRELVRELETLLARIPRGYGKPLDQIRRAALSITLNTAEGAGEFSVKEKARFYRMARRSATEAAPVLDHFVDRGALPDSAIRPARRLLHRIIGALTNLIRKYQDTPFPAPPPEPEPDRSRSPIR